MSHYSVVGSFPPVLSLTLTRPVIDLDLVGT